MKATKVGRSLSKLRCVRTFLPTTARPVPAPVEVLEVPLSVALNRRLPKPLQHAYARLPSPYTSKRILRALRLLRPRWLRPSYSSLEDMIGLAKDLARWNEPVLNLLFHSSEAIVGGSPYNRTQGELDAFCDRLDRFLSFATPRTSRCAGDVCRIPFSLRVRPALKGQCGSSTSHRTSRPTRPPTRCCRGTWATGAATMATKWSTWRTPRGSPAGLVSADR